MQPVPRSQFSAVQVMTKLQQKFGAGRDERRVALYKRIGAMVELHGEPAWKALCECVAQAAGAKAPDRYFCAAVVRCFSERGFVPNDF